MASDGYVSIKSNDGFFDDDGPTIILDRPDTIKSKSVNLGSDGPSLVSGITINNGVKRAESTISEATIEGTEIDLNGSKTRTRHGHHGSGSKFRDRQRGKYNSESDSRDSRSYDDQTKEPSYKKDQWSSSKDQWSSASNNEWVPVPVPVSEPVEKKEYYEDKKVEEPKEFREPKVESKDFSFLLNKEKTIKPVEKDDYQSKPTVDYSSGSDTELKPSYSNDIRNFGSNSYDKQYSDYKQEYKEKPVEESRYRPEPEPRPKSYEEPREPPSTSDDYVPQFQNEIEEKIYYLIKLANLEKKGISLTREYSLKDELSYIKMEYRAQSEQLRKDESVQWYKDLLLLGTVSVEKVNSTLNPNGKYVDVKLDGWSRNVTENMDKTFVPIFEKLYKKYQSDGDMLSPEIQLAFALAMSGVIFHFTQKYLPEAGPNITAAIQQQPGLVAGLMGAIFNANRMTQQQQQPQMIPQQQVYPMAQTGQFQGPAPMTAQGPGQGPMSGPNIDIGSLLNNFVGNQGGPDVLDRPAPTREAQDPPLGNIYRKQSSLKADDDAMSMTSEISTGIGYVKNKKGSKKGSTKIVSL